MKRFAATLLGALAFLGLAALSAEAAGLPIVIGATVDFNSGTLTLTGRNFGSNPS